MPFIIDFKQDFDVSVKETLQYVGATWADIITIGIKNGEKPSVMIDKSGSMMNKIVRSWESEYTEYTDEEWDSAVEIFKRLSDFTKRASMNLDVQGIEDYMDFAIEIVRTTALILMNRGKVNLNDIPVKTWGSEVNVVGTLADFADPMNEISIKPDEGTEHQLWAQESFPLVITDDENLFTRSGKSSLLTKGNRDIVEKNDAKFSWCFGGNIIVIGRGIRTYINKQINMSNKINTYR
jgi:hypothetical protein